MPTTDFYTGLITSWHRGRPKFVSTVSNAVEPLTELQSFLATLPEQFDLDVAIGAQLDIVGQWIGQSRNIPVPIQDLWFSFDDPIRGWDKGIWKGAYDTGIGISTLADEPYRALLKAKIAANNWDGTVAGAQAALNIVFADPATLVFVQDNADMSVTIGVAGKIPSLLNLVLLEKYLPLKPVGVRSYYTVTTVNNTPLFGFDVSNEYVSGFDTGAWGAPPEYIAEHTV